MATQVKTDLIANNAITDAKIANVAITGVTASSGDSSTSLATTAFVAGEINSLIDSAPGALNTLNELAAAMGDDANFSTTVTNSIAAKLPLAGGALTGALTSTSSITAASGGNEIQIGTDGNIEITRTAGGAYIDFKDSTSEDYDQRIQATSTGHNFSGTISSGAITSTGNITNDYNDTISMNYAPSAGSYHKGMTGTSFASGNTARGLHLFNFDNDTNLGINFWVGTNASKQFAARIDDSGKVGIGTDSPSQPLQINPASGGYNLFFGRGNSTPGSSDPWLGIFNDTTIGPATYGWGFYDSNSDGSFQIWNRNNSTTGAVALTIKRGGNVGIGADPSTILHIKKQAQLVQLMNF